MKKEDIRKLEWLIVDWIEKDDEQHQIIMGMEKILAKYDEIVFRKHKKQLQEKVK